MMTSNEGLSYVFKNVSEAITFIIWRTKEMPLYEDFPIEKFNNARIGNIGSSDVYVSIETIEKETKNNSTYMIKTLRSYQYDKDKRKLEKEVSEINEILSGNNTEVRFIDDVNQKSKMLRKEFDRFKPSINRKANNDKITKILDRYFGMTGWQKYWITTRQLSVISVEMTLHVLLNNDETVDISSEKNMMM